MVHAPLCAVTADTVCDVSIASMPALESANTGIA